MHLKSFALLLCGVITTSLAAESAVRPTAFTHNKNFVYDYKTAVVNGSQQGFRLDDRVDQVAKIINRDLDQSMFFNTEFVKDVKKVRKYHVSTKKSCKENIATLHWASTADQVRLGCTYFNRNSDTLVVVAGGFTNEREMMTPFVDMFPHYDVVLMDWRGHGFNPEEFVIDPIQRIFAIAPRDITFGEKEHLDVFAVVEGFRARKKLHNNGAGYAHVYGLGVCYGAFVFAKTAALTERVRFGLPDALKSHNPKMINAAERELSHLDHQLKNYKEIREHGLFDKIILDGCWLSLPLFVEKIQNDFATLVNPQTGGFSKHWFFSRSGVKKAIDFIAARVIGIQHHSDINLLDYVSTLTKTPLLFFFGKNDYMIRRYEFETLYNAIPAPDKAVIVTSNHHVRNHFKQKELYKLAADLFLHLPHDQFIEYLQSPEKIVEYNTQHFLNACATALQDKSDILDYGEEPVVLPLVLPESD